MFYIVLFLAAGFMRGSDHIALGQYFISNPVLMGIPVSVWCFYTWMVIDFNRRTCVLASNSFLSDFILFDNSVQWKLTHRVAWKQLVPIYAYGGFLSLLSVVHGTLVALTIILISCFCLSMITTMSLRISMRNATREKKTHAAYLWMLKTIRKPLPLIFNEGIVRAQPLAITGYKIVALLVLYAILFLYTRNTYDLRLASLGTLTCFSLSTTFVYALHRFENIDLGFLRQLPLHLSSRYSYIILTILIFTLPEGMMLIRNFPADLNWSLTLHLYVFGLSILMLLYSFFYINDRTLEKTMPYVYFLYISFFVLILFDVPLWLMSSVSLTISAFLFRRHYYRLEFKSDIKQQESPAR